MDFDLKQSLAILSRTPAVLRALLQELPSEWTQNCYGPNTWSAHEVMGHLIWGERTDWMPRVRHILASGESVAFEPFDRQGHVQLCQEKSTKELIEIFSTGRSNNLEELRAMSLSRDELEKTGQHPALGTATVSELLATWTVHDLNHIAQISKAMAFQYQSAVGPWEAYLSILSPPNPR